MITAALILAAVLQLADAATTIWILRHGGVELNPLMRRLIDAVGVGAAMAIKVAFVLALLSGGYLIGLFERVPWAAYVIAAMCVAVVVHNALTIAKMRQHK